MSKPTLFLVPLLVFILVQSFFDRYLVAVGNPASLLLLLVFISLSLRPKRKGGVVESEAGDSAVVRGHMMPVSR